MFISLALTVLMIVFVTGCGVVTMASVWVARNIRKERWRFDNNVIYYKKRFESEVQYSSEVRDERDEARKRSASNLERYESEATARHEAREECGKARKELERVRASLRDYEKTREECTQASAASVQFLKERDAARKKQGAANSLLVAIRKENSRLMDERDEAHQDESKLQNSINHLATRHYSNSDNPDSNEGTRKSVKAMEAKASNRINRPDFV